MRCSCVAEVSLQVEEVLGLGGKSVVVWIPVVGDGVALEAEH